MLGVALGRDPAAVAAVADLGAALSAALLGFTGPTAPRTRLLLGLGRDDPLDRLDRCTHTSRSLRVFGLVHAGQDRRESQRDEHGGEGEEFVHGVSAGMFMTILVRINALWVGVDQPSSRLQDLSIERLRILDRRVLSRTAELGIAP
jgi:hypothetical protein